MSSGADLIGEINDLWNKLVGKFDDLRDAINWILDKIPGFLDWIVDKLKDGWNKLCDKFQEVVDQVTYFFGHMGSPGALSAAADSWSTNVGGPVSNEVTTVDAGMLLVDDTWSGDAASQYKQHIPLQKAALQAIKTTYTDTIATALDKVQNALFIWYAAIAGAITAFISCMIGAIIAAGSVAGAPGAPFIALGGVLAFAAAFGGGTFNLKSQAAGANTMLVAKLSDNTAFPNGAWPKATA